MKKQRFNRKRIFAMLLAALVFVGILGQMPQEVSAVEAWPADISIEAPSAIVMEVNTGAILYEKNSHERNYPASITKILTTWLGVEYCQLDEIVTFSKDAVYKNEGATSHIARDLGEEMTMEQTLYAVMLESANECAWAVAEHVAAKTGGGEPEFVDLMNQRAAELGCTDTHFNNPNGLPDEQHYTSAYDMALISCAAYKNEAFRTITGTKKYTIPPTNRHKDPTYLNNHHKLLHLYKTGNYVNEYCTGGKTGYTTVAHHTLVTYAEKDGMAICVVVMREQDPSQLIDTNRLIEYAFNNFSLMNVTEEDLARLNMEEKSLGLLNPNKRFVSMDSSSSVVLPKGVAVSQAECTVTAGGDAGSGRIASLEYTYAGHRVGAANIVASPAAAEKSIFETADRKEEADVIRISPLWIMVWVIVAVLAGLALILILRIAAFLKKEKERLLPKKNQEELEEAAKLSQAKLALRKNERKRQAELRRMEREKRAEERSKKEEKNSQPERAWTPLPARTEELIPEDLDQEKDLKQDPEPQEEDDDLEELSVEDARPLTINARKAQRAEARAARAAAREKRHKGDL